MTRSPAIIGPNANLHVAFTLMAQHRIRHLCVVEGARLVGILSDHDILEVAPSVREGEVRFSAALAELRVGDHMTKELRRTHPNMKICDAAEYMFEIGAHSLPVVRGERLVGILTSSDCIRAFGKYVDALDDSRVVERARESQDVDPKTLAPIH